MVRAQSLVAAAAALDGRARASEADLWPLIYIVPTAEQQAGAPRPDVGLLEPSDNAVLHAAAEDAAGGPFIRALGSPPPRTIRSPPPPSPARRDVAREVEALLREIDAGIAEATARPSSASSASDSWTPSPRPPAAGASAAMTSVEVKWGPRLSSAPCALHRAR